MTSLVDYHCHLDLFPDFENKILECENEKIHTLTVTTTPHAWPRNYDLTKNTTYVRAALGLHPQLVSQRSSEISVWDKYFDEAYFIGEIGLDAGPTYYKSFQAQIIVFEHIINRCADHGGRVLSIHSVRAVTPVLDIIEKRKANVNNKIILHWFSGNLTQARRAIKMGCYFSINSAMLTKTINHELMNIIPINRILTETDGPFNRINNKPLKPQDVIICIQMISNILKKTNEEIKLMVLNNILEVNDHL